MSSNESWFSRLLTAFSSLFSGDSPRKAKASTSNTRSKADRRIAGHWPVYVEFSKHLQEELKPSEGASVSLRFSASDAALLASLKIKAREFEGQYIADKKAALVQIPEQLVQELSRRGEHAVYVEGFFNGKSLGSRKFTIPLRF